MKGYVTFEKRPLKGRDLVCKTSTFKRSVMKEDITSRKKRGRRKRMHLFGPLSKGEIGMTKFREPNMKKILILNIVLQIKKRR